MRPFLCALVLAVALAGCGGGSTPPLSRRVRGGGDTPGGAAEWSFHVDPAAAPAVLRSSARMTLVPLDATSQVPVTRSSSAGIAAGRFDRARFERVFLSVLARAG